jgi:hypothetical protein
MLKNSKKRIAVFFTIFFMAVITAPTVITSIDDSVDISYFFGIGEEEEEESKNLKLLFENSLELSDHFFVAKTDVHLIGYTFKKYPKPNLNLILPPPEFIA